MTRGSTCNSSRADRSANQSLAKTKSRHQFRQILGGDLPHDVVIDAKIVVHDLWRMPMMSAHRMSGWLLQNSRETGRAASPIVWIR